MSDAIDYQEEFLSAEIARIGLARGNVAVFESQFRAYAVYRNDGTEALGGFAQSALNQSREQYDELVLGYQAQEQALRAKRAGDQSAVRAAFRESLERLAAYEQGEAVLQPIYEREISITDDATLANPRVAYRHRPPHEVEQDPPQTTQTLAEAMNTLRAYHNTGRGWMPFYGWATATDVAGRVHTFQGDDIGDFDQRMQWIRRMADTLVEARFERGAAYVARFNRGLSGGR